MPIRLVQDSATRHHRALRAFRPILSAIGMWLTLLLTLVLWFPVPQAAAAADTQDGEPDIEVFTREGCPHCKAAKVFLDEMQRERPGLRMVYRDVGKEPTAFSRLQTLAQRHQVGPLGVPAFYLRGELLIGYTSEETTGRKIQDLLDTPPQRSLEELPVGACPAESPLPCLSPSSLAPPDEETIETRWLGRLSAREMGLPLFTVTLGLLDGFNPCAMWVLLFLLSLLVNLHDRRKMIVIAGTFVLASGLVYFAFMAAWLNLFVLIGWSRATEIALGLIAILIGGVNVKDFLGFRQGLSVSIPDAAKPGLYARVRSILNAEHLAGAMGGVILLALLVNVIELLCTAGFPALYTRILTLRQLPWWEYYGYLGLYNLAYMFDDSVMVTIAVVTMGRRKLQEHEGRWLKLISGAVMLLLGAVLLFKPGWLNW
jgi:glutaredoxin